MTRAGVGAASLLCVIALGTWTPAEAAADRTSTICSTVADPTASAARVWQVAAARLTELATPSRTLPFGATGSASYQRTSAYAWTAGFYPASLWLMYEQTKDAGWLARARSFTDRVLPVARWTGTHDLGFMVGLPARLGMRLDPAPTRQARYRAAIITAAASLSTRWNRRVGAVKSGDYGGQWGLIIDSAMNAPMLIEASALVGGSRGDVLKARGLQHLLTLAASFIRPDGSTAHRLAFDATTGRLIGPVPGQGRSSTSTWARGQAWAINGFTQGYALTGDARLLDAARRTSDYWLARVPGGCVPAWDLDVASDAAPRDSSAAAIAADGLLALSRVDPDPVNAARYLAAGRATATALTAPTWVPDDSGAVGVLQHQAYNIPADKREGTYVWGDTYLLAAMRLLT